MGEHDQNSDQQAIWNLIYENSRQDVSDRLKFQIEFAQAALKNLTIANGGAIIALFTFIGHDGAKFDHEMLWLSFSSFAAGLTFNLSAFIAAFYSQLFFMNASGAIMWNAQCRLRDLEPKTDEDTPRRFGNIAMYVGIGCIMLGLIGFIGGAIFALQGIS